MRASRCHASNGFCDIAHSRHVHDVDTSSSATGGGAWYGLSKCQSGLRAVSGAEARDGACEGAIWGEGWRASRDDEAAACSRESSGQGCDGFQGPCCCCSRGLDNQANVQGTSVDRAWSRGRRCCGNGGKVRGDLVVGS
jgi:hypothetical protein